MLIASVVRPSEPAWRGSHPRGRAPLTAIVAGALLAALALACGPARVTDDSPFDILIVSLDACRADRIGAYGYQERPTTPVIDALAEDPDAIVYTRSYSAANWTKPTVASLLTGLYPFQHGVTNQGLAGGPGEGEGSILYRTQVLAPGFDTLAERLGEAGYRTMALVTSYHLIPRYGFDQGFDEFYDPDSLPVGDVGRVDKLLGRVRRLDSGYFAYVHQNACHHPFAPADRDKAMMAEFDIGYPEEARAEAGIDFTTSAISHKIKKGEVELTAEDARFLSLIYDAKLRRVDEKVVGPLIAGLRRAGRWDRTLFILTADHGEELYEHRGYSHAHAMWQEVIHVPLIVKFPKGEVPPGLPKRVGAPTSTVDLYPSLLELLDLPVAAHLPGRSLFDAPGGGFVLSQSPRWVAVVGAREKLILHDGAPRFLFDLESDPLERDDLAALRPERASRLAELAEFAATPVYERGVTVETELSPKALETLRGLGYIE